MKGLFGETEPSAQSETISVKTSSISFEGLPREIRDKIYFYALVQEKPIEFAPPDIQNRFSALIYGPLFMSEYDCVETEGYHISRYRNEIVPAINCAFLLSKSIYKEASEVYFEQNEFRFTGFLGWPLLGMW